MKVKKLENSVFSIGAVSAVLAFLLVLVSFLVGQDEIVFGGFMVFVTAFKTLFSFDFANMAYLVIFVLFVVSVACLLVWLIEIIKNKGNVETVLKFVVCAIVILAISTFLVTMFVTKVTFNSRQVTVFDALRSIEGITLVKVLGSLSLGFAYLSLMLTTFYAFLNLGMLNIAGRDYREVELSVSKKNNAKNK